MTHTIEHLTKAVAAAKSITSDLREALKTCDAVAALVLYPLIADAVRQAQTIDDLRNALELTS